jgi:hypothetical protein
MDASNTIHSLLKKLAKESRESIPPWFDIYPDWRSQYHKRSLMMKRVAAMSDELGADADEGEIIERFARLIADNGFERELVSFVMYWFIERWRDRSFGQKPIGLTILADIYDRVGEFIYLPHCKEMNQKIFASKWPLILSTRIPESIYDWMTPEVLAEAKELLRLVHVDHTIDEFAEDVNKLVSHTKAIDRAWHARECVLEIDGRDRHRIPLSPLLQIDLPYDKIKVSHYIGRIMIKHSPARRRFLALLILTGGRMEGSLFLPLRVVENELLGYLADVIFR